MKTVSIGRNRDNSVVLSDIKASRYHCTITQYDNGTCQISDLGSLNGTYVNGRRIRGSSILSYGDAVRIGDTMIPWQSYLFGHAGYGTVADPYSNHGYNPYIRPPENRPGSGFGIAGMVLGIIGIFPLALIFSIIALSRNERNRGFGITGLVFGIVYTVIAIIAGVCCIVLYA